MNFGKVISGLVAFVLYFCLIFVILYFYNIHQTKAKNYVKKNDNRVTVTLVNSDKTVLNKRDKTSNHQKPVTPVVPKKIIPKKVTPQKHTPKLTTRIPMPKKVHVPKKVMPKKVIPKKVVPKKVVPKKKVPKKVIPKKVVPKKKVPKKVIPKKVVPKKKVPKKVIPKKVVPKKKVPKKVIPKKVVPKKKVPKKVIPKKVVPKKKVPKKVIPKKVVPKKTAKDLFSSVKTNPFHKQPVKRVHRPPVIQPPSRVKHNSSFADRTRATHQSGHVSNANREKGIENAYIADVKRRMNNWNAIGASGQRVTVHLTIFNSGKFRYTISGLSGAMKNSLKQYLDTLNRMGLKRHKKSSPYSIKVRFTVR